MSGDIAGAHPFTVAFYGGFLKITSQVIKSDLTTNLIDQIFC
jgi:hypothetical protein